jgi:hypothetical protein
MRPVRTEEDIVLRHLWQRRDDGERSRDGQAHHAGPNLTDPPLLLQLAFTRGLPLLRRAATRPQAPANQKTPHTKNTTAHCRDWNRRLSVRAAATLPNPVDGEKSR